VQELNGFGRASAGGPYRFTVRAKDGSPICDIFRVLQPSRDLEFCAQERGSEFGDEFLERVGIVTEAFAEFAREAVCSAAPVAVLVTGRRVKGRDGLELLRSRKSYRIGRGRVKRAIATETDGCANRGEIRFDTRKTFDLWPRRYWKARRQSVDLRDIEDGERLPEGNPFLDDLALGVLLLAVERRNEEHRGAVFSLANASIQVAGLLKRHPFCGFVSECGLRHPQVEDVRSAIGAPRGEVRWHIRDAGRRPRAHPGRNACELVDDLRGNGGADLLQLVSDERALEAREALEDLLGSEFLGGKMGLEIVKHNQQFRGVAGTDARGRYVDVFLQNTDVPLLSTDIGFCFAFPDTAACKLDGARQGTTGMCGDCSNLIVMRRHVPEWKRRLVDHDQFRAQMVDAGVWSEVREASWKRQREYICRVITMLPGDPVVNA
jgi:hypothetical protein